MTQQPTPQLNDNDIELLSAYIDDQLSAGERSTLEVRLEREPALREALAELRATVELLHELPVLPPPRSFTIDPASVRPRGFWLVRWMWLGSALATLLLAVTLTFNMVRFGQGAASMAPAPAAESMEQAAPQAELAQEEPEATMAPQATTAPAMPAPEARLSAATPEAGIAEAPAEGVEADGAATPQPFALPEADAGQPPAAGEAMPTEEEGMAAEEAAGDTAATAPDEPERTATEVLPAAEGGLVLMQIVPIALALLAIGLAVSAFWLSRRERG